MVRQMLYLDPPEHTRMRMLAAKGFAPPRVEVLRDHIAAIVERLLDAVQEQAAMDLIADFARPLPAIVSCEMLGLPTDDWPQLTSWTGAFAELLGNFQHNPVRAAVAKATVDDMTAYFRQAIRQSRGRPDGLLRSLMTAEVDGDRLTEEEVIANTIITLVGGLETTTNLIANGMLALLRHPDQWALLRGEPGLVPSAVEEFLRFESPIQHTARLAPADGELGGRPIRRRQAVIAVMAAANRDPARFPDPDRLDIRRTDNRHLAFGWAAHHCFGAPLARLEAQLAFAALVSRMGSARLGAELPVWRQNAGAFRGLESLHVEF
jgi:cytochrome P450